MSSVALCSVACVMTWFPFFLYIAATPLIARLLLSVAPLVKITSLAARQWPCRDLTAGALDGLLGLPPERVGAARGVTVLLGEVQEHRIHHGAVRAGGRVIVHVNRHLRHDRIRVLGAYLWKDQPSRGERFNTAGRAASARREYGKRVERRGLGFRVEQFRERDPPQHSHQAAMHLGQLALHEVHAPRVGTRRCQQPFVGSVEG